MPTAAPLPVHLLNRPFRVDDALARGTSSKRLRASDLSKPFHGVRVVSPPITLSEAARCYAVVMPADQFFSHATAAVLWGLPLPWRLEQDARLHVTTPGRDRSARGRGIVGHRSTAPHDLHDLAGVRVSSPTQTWLDLASCMSLDELIELGDALVWPARGLATREQLEDALARLNGRPGALRARAALVEIREGSRSPGETRLRLVVLRAGLPEPELNSTVFADDGSYLGSPDLVFRRQRKVVEYEGDYHRTSRDAFRSDIRRRERFEDNGWRVIRATADDLTSHRQQFVRRLARLLADR